MLDTLAVNEKLANPSLHAELVEELWSHQEDPYAYSPEGYWLTHKSEMQAELTNWIDNVFPLVKPGDRVIIRAQPREMLHLPLKRVPALRDRVCWIIVGGGPEILHPLWAVHLQQQAYEIGAAFWFRSRGSWSWDCEMPLEDDEAIEIPMDWSEHPDRYACVDSRGKRLTGLGGADERFFARVDPDHPRQRLLRGRAWDETPRLPVLER